MKIIAVNINKNIAEMSIKKAIERAWKLNKKNVSECEYVVGVINGAVQGYFKITPNTINTDSQQSNRVSFELSYCNNQEWQMINQAIGQKNLSGFVTKYI